MKDKLLNKELLKKWWFWVIVVAVLGVIGLASGGGSQTTSNNSVVTTKQQASYKYTGQPYQIVHTDLNVGVTGLSELWVETNAFDYSSDAFKAQVKAIITDIAHTKGTTKFMANIITDDEVLSYKTDSTGFIARKGLDYVKSTVNPKSEATFVASYTGGFDQDKMQKSDDASAFSIMWFSAATTGNAIVGKYVGTEQWKPSL